jgi:hypothetical protein
LIQLSIACYLAAGAGTRDRRPGDPNGLAAEDEGRPGPRRRVLGMDPRDLSLQPQAYARPKPCLRGDPPLIAPQICLHSDRRTPWGHPYRSGVLPGRIKVTEPNGRVASLHGYFSQVGQAPSRPCNPRVVAEFVGCVFLTVEPNREALVIDLSGGVGCIEGRRDCRAPSQGDGALLIEP